MKICKSQKKSFITLAGLIFEGKSKPLQPTLIFESGNLVQPSLIFVSGNLSPPSLICVSSKPLQPSLLLVSNS